MTVPYPIPDEALAQHQAIVGRTGSGKTFAAKSMAERLLDQGQRVCIVDPVGVWYGLRTSSDGDPKGGYPVVIFGGEHADVPITAGVGKMLAELVATRNLPCVVDLGEFSNAERHRFMTDFLETLYRVNRQALHLIVDEADDIAPQNPLPESKRMLGAFDRIIRRGRSRGFRVTMLTQRPAVLNKNALTQASTLVAMRLPGPQDRKAIEDWVKGSGDDVGALDVLSSLSRLQPGEGWVWAPDLGLLERVKFPMIRTLDTSRAPTGDEDLPVAELAAVDLEGLAEALGDADEVLPTPGAEAPGISQAEMDRIQKEAWADGRKAGLVEGACRLAAALESAHHKAAAAAIASLKETGQAIPADPGKVLQGTLPPSRQRAEKPPAKAPAVDPGGLSTAALGHLRVLADHAPVRLTWAQACTLGKRKPRGGTFNTARKQLRDGGLVVEHGDLVEITDEGLARVGSGAHAVRSKEEAVEAWLAALPTPANAMLTELLRNGTAWISRDDLAGRLGKAPRGGQWNNGLATLRRNGLIEEAGDRLRAAAVPYGENHG